MVPFQLVMLRSSPLSSPYEVAVQHIRARQSHLSTWLPTTRLFVVESNDELIAS